MQAIQSNITSQLRDVSQSFANFKAHRGRRYRNSTAETRAQQHFHSNLKYIAAENAKVGHAVPMHWIRLYHRRSRLARVSKTSKHCEQHVEARRHIASCLISRGADHARELTLRKCAADRSF